MAGQVSGDESLEELMDLVAKLQKDVNWLMDGNLSSKNVREIGDYQVGSTYLRSRDGDVGLSSANDAADPVRLWAGSANKDTAPWRVYKSGKSVMTGALIQSKASGYPLVVMDPNDALFGAYMSSSRYIKMFALEGLYGTPALQFRDEGVPTYAVMYIDTINHDFNILSPGNIYIGAGLSDLTLSGNRVRFDSWSSVFSNASSQTLQQALDAKASVVQLAGKATAGISTGSSGGHNHGIPDGAQLMLVGGGSVTFFSAPQHSHAQI